MKYHNQNSMHYYYTKNIYKNVVKRQFYQLIKLEIVKIKFYVQFIVNNIINNLY